VQEAFYQGFHSKTDVAREDTMDPCKYPQSSSQSHHQCSALL
jgi:hypothetical protein